MRITHSTVSFQVLIDNKCLYVFTRLRSPFKLGKKKKIVMLPSPDQNLKIGSVGQFFLYFFFTYRERVEFSNIFLKVSKWGKLGRNAVKTHIQVLFLSHWIQILANSSPKSDIFKKTKTKQTKNPDPVFFAFYGRSGEGNITFFFFWP